MVYNELRPVERPIRTNRLLESIDCYMGHSLRSNKAPHARVKSVFANMKRTAERQGTRPAQTRSVEKLIAMVVRVQDTSPLYSGL
jgi:hypothetical protein